MPGDRAKEWHTLLDERSPQEQSIASEVDPLVQSMGLSLVDVRWSNVRDRMRVSIVIAGESGPDIEQISRLHRLLMPRMEVLLDHRDLDLELSSPGIGRELNRRDELRPFCRKPIEVIAGADSSWRKVQLLAVETDGISISAGSGTAEPKVISWAELRRVRLAEDDGGRA